MSDVVGLDGGWVSDFVKQGSLASLTDLMEEAGYDDSEPGGADRGRRRDLHDSGCELRLSGVRQSGPAGSGRHRESAYDTERICRGCDYVDGRLTTTSTGWCCRSLGASQRYQNDVMSWVWASGGSMMKDGMPDLTNDEVRSGLEYVKGLYERALLRPVRSP